MSLDPLSTCLASIPSTRSIEEYLGIMNLRVIEHVVDCDDSDEVEGSALTTISAIKGKVPPNLWKHVANVIIDTDTREIVARGPPDVFPIPSREAAALSIDDSFSMEKITFGTVCWLYHREGKWNLATKNSVRTDKSFIRVEGPSVLRAFSDYTPLDTFDGNEAYTYGFILTDHRLHCVDKPEDGLRPLSIIVTATGESIPMSLTAMIEDKVAWIHKCSAVYTSEMGYILRPIGQLGPGYIVKSPRYLFIDRFIGKKRDDRSICIALAMSTEQECEYFRHAIPQKAYILPVVQRALHSLDQYIRRHRERTKALGAEVHISPALSTLSKALGPSYDLRHPPLRAAKHMETLLLSIIPSGESNVTPRPMMQIPS